MPSFPSRGPRLPSAALAELEVPSDERVVSWGSGVSPLGHAASPDSYAVATNKALYLSPWGRVPWNRITKATWEEPVLTVTMVDERGRARRPMAVRIEQPRDVPAAVHDRVTASVVVSQRAELEGGGSALMVARSDPDDGRITWTVVFDAGTDPTDPERRRAADEALDRLRASLGI